MLTVERIEMRDWELHDFAIQIVRGKLRKDGKELMSWTGNLAVDPAIWFVRRHRTLVGCCPRRTLLGAPENLPANWK